MWEQTYQNDDSCHHIERNLFRLYIQTRAKKDILNGRTCIWNVYIHFLHWHYGYVQINNSFTGTIEQAMEYAETQLRELKEDIPV